MPHRPALGLLTALLVALGVLVATPATAVADRDCGDFSSQRAAQIFFLNQGGPHSDPHRLDSDSDGIACESNPGPYYYGTTPPGGGDKPDPKPKVTKVRSSVQLALSPSKRIAGEFFRIKVSVQPAVSRKVLIQRKVNGRWKALTSGVTGGNGKASGQFKAPKSTTAYRALVKAVKKGNKKYSAATSQVRSVTVQRQRITLGFNHRTVAEGRQVRAAVRATPVRAGRKVVLQMRSSGTWRTVRTSTFDRHGRASFSFTPKLGQTAYRAVAQRHRGALPAQSASKTVTARDLTPPPVPSDLAATPGDGSVELSWSRALPADFSHHEVWVRTAGTPWSLLTITEAATVEISALPNGVTHWFSVTSVDTRGNASARTAAVTATPTAPVLVD